MNARILGPQDGLVLGPDAGVRDRFLIDSADWGGRFSAVEHLLAPKSIAAPMHRHTREDEFSLILEGRVWFVVEDEEYVAEVGDLVFKPRGEWHTFFNASNAPARILELISPGGLERLFRLLGSSESDVDLERLAADYGCEADDAATARLIEAYHLTFG
jgi:mannose-6-phosphate isomerase-like protein (cupin superfamily)